MIDKSKFRNSMGAILTTRLFLEMSYAEQSHVIYTLKRKDDTVRDLPSLYRLYMEMEDPLEIDFAETFFDSYEHWEQICETAWFKEYIYQWRKELELKLRARALRSIRDIAKNTHGGKAFEANKFLLSDGWVKSTNKDDTKRGRPSKEEIRKAAGEIAMDNSLLKEDLERLGIN